MIATEMQTMKRHATSEWDLSILKDMQPDKKTFGEILYQVLTERFNRDRIIKIESDRAVELDEILKKHLRTHERYCRRFRKYKTFDPAWETEIRLYEISVVLKPYMPIKVSPERFEEIKAWLWPIDQTERAEMCHLAREHWREARHRASVDPKIISDFAIFAKN